MIRLIAVDLDGTLLGADKKISDRNARALRLCREKGVLIAFCSGRSRAVISRFAREAGLENCLIVSSNGARADELASSGPLYSMNIDPETAKIAAERLIAAGIYVECYSDGIIYMANLKPLRHHNHRPGLGPDGVTVFADDPVGMLEKGILNAEKLIVFEDDEAMIERAQILLRGLPLKLSQSDKDNLEILSPNAGKGEALSRYAAEKSISKDEIMAFGDQTNDLDMLMAAGWPVAMDNAVEPVKQAARLIAPHHDQSGVAQILEKYVLEGGNAE